MIDFSNDEETYKLLREKIKSKMDVTKFFSGFVSVVLSIMLKDIISGLNYISGLNDTYSWSLVAGMCLIVFSLAANIAALFSYDRLLMPPKFLEGSTCLKAINKHLKLHMVRAWRAMFVPAVMAFLGALIAFSTAQVKTCLHLTLLLGFGGAALAAFLLYIIFKAPFDVPGLMKKGVE